jgi:hypothetical protein
LDNNRRINPGCRASLVLVLVLVLEVEIEHEDDDEDEGANLHREVSFVVTV